jgi:hypothetical protein
LKNQQRFLAAVLAPRCRRSHAVQAPPLSRSDVSSGPLLRSASVGTIARLRHRVKQKQFALVSRDAAGEQWVPVIS